MNAEVHTQAQAQADLVAATAADLLGAGQRTALQTLARNASGSVRGRVLVIDARGRVLADSAGPGELGTSYASRPEIRAALSGRTGPGQTQLSDARTGDPGHGSADRPRGPDRRRGPRHTEHRRRPQCRPPRPVRGDPDRADRAGARAGRRRGDRGPGQPADRATRAGCAARGARGPDRAGRRRGQPGAALAGGLVQRDRPAASSVCSAPSASSWRTPRISCARR